MLVVPVVAAGLVKEGLVDTHIVPRTVVLSVSLWGDPTVRLAVPWDGRTGHGQGGQVGAQPPLLALERPVGPG